MSYEIGGKTTLLVIGEWAVCRFQDEVQKYDEIYAEHGRACRDKRGAEYDDRVCYWSWEHDDGVNRGGSGKAEHVERCWACNDPVPAGIVALVVLSNWNRKSRYD